MSSINFTGLSNIKVGSADCTVYLGANKMWPTGISPTFAVVDTISSYTDRTYNWVYDRSTKTWNHLENNSYRALTVPTTTKGIYIVDENYNFVEPSSFSGNADNAIGIAFLNWSRTFTDSNSTVVTNNFIMGAPQINTGTWLTSTKPVDNRSSYLSLPLFAGNSNWNTTDPSTSRFGNASGEDETQIVEDAINAGTLENCTMVPYVRKFFNNKNNILKDFPYQYQLGYVPSAAEVVRITGNTYGTTSSHTAFEKLGYRNFDNDSSVNKTLFVTIDKASSDITYNYPNIGLYMYTPTNGNTGSNNNFALQNVIPCMNPLLITPPISITFNSVSERSSYKYVYNGLISRIGNSTQKYIDDNWIDYTPIFMVNNTQYNNGEWRPNANIGYAEYNVKSELDFDIHCEWNQAGAGDKIYLYVDNKQVAISNSSSKPIDYSLKAGTYVIKLSTYDSFSTGKTYILKDKTYMKIK
jgi:hypothetical protein